MKLIINAEIFMTSATQPTTFTNHTQTLINNVFTNIPVVSTQYTV